MFFFVTLYLQQVQRYSALRAGLAFLPLAGGVIVIAPSASWLVGRFGPAPTLIVGLPGPPPSPPLACPDPFVP